MSDIKQWISNKFTTRFIWWVVRTFLFPTLSLILLCLFLSIDGAKYNILQDIVTRPEIVFVAISSCATAMYDLITDSSLWPHTRRAVAAFTVLLFLELICVAVYGYISAKIISVNIESRVTIIGWTSGLSFIWALFVQLILSPSPTISQQPLRKKR